MQSTERSRRSAIRSHLAIRRIFACLVVLGIVATYVPATTVPVQAAPAAGLTFVEVAAPDINCLFDNDCKIVVNDNADHFVPPAASGDAFLQSRLWPKGEPGTKGEGLYPYLYRIDMRNAAGVTAAACVTAMRIEFGDVVPMDYNGDGSLEDAFVITKGGIGNVKPTHIEQVGTALLIKFEDPPICVGSSQGNGDSSYFIGFASKLPHQDVISNLVGTVGLNEMLDAWAPKISEEVKVRIRESSNKLFAAEVELPQLQLLPAKSPEGKEFTQLLLPSVDPFGHAPGVPDVPVVRRMLAVPRGAEVRVKGVEIQASHYISNVLVYPSQTQPADVALGQEEEEEPPKGLYGDPPFALDPEAYRSKEDYPAQVVDVIPMGRMRDLDLVQLNIAAAQYNAAKGALNVVESVQFEVVFEGGEGGFLPRDQADNPFDTSYDGIYAQVLNNSVLHEYLFGELVARVCIGHEFLIITHPDFRPAADDLRNWKVSRGLSTAVYERGTNPGQIGNSREDIRDFIRKQFNGCLVRPSYVLILGDAEMVPTFYRTTGYGEAAGTDLDYALMDNTDLLPDVAHGRIPVDTLTQAQQVVDKIIAYEKTPPFNASFYNRASFAAYFQCCRNSVVQDGTAVRSFAETAEFVRNGLLGQGYSVERIYTTSTGYQPEYAAAGRNPTPNRYYNGTLLPADLRAGSGFPWDGDTNDVIDAINQGRFLVLHRDHGWTNGWGDPEFETGDLSSLTNGSLTPVVYSINCASGMFDNETLNPAQQVWPYSSSASYVSWAEELLRMQGGAVGIIGDTRVSPSWENSALTRGLFDATWPSVMPAYGGAGSIKRLGDILNYGKAYMVSQIGVAQTAGSISTADANTDLIAYHVLGDPTMKMYTSWPYLIKIPLYYYEIEILKPGEWVVKYPLDEAIMTALQNGMPVARVPVIGGEAKLDFIDGVDPDAPIQLSVQHPSGLSVELQAPESHSQITPEQGGTILHEASKFQLQFGGGAVGGTTDVVYDTTEGPSQELPEGVMGLRSFNLNAFAQGEGGPEEVSQFGSAYEMMVGYDESDLGGASTASVQPAASGQSIDESTLEIQYLDEANNQWKPLSCTVDTEQNEVTCQGDHFTEFALTGQLKSDEPNEPGDTPGQSVYLPLIQTGN